MDETGAARRPDVPTLRLLRRARDLIDRRYADGITIGAVAAEVHLSQAHFTRSFRAAYGETPHQYLLTRRLERAAWLLRRGSTVTDACTAVGFSSLGSFSSRFREVYGETPSAYAVRDHDDVALVPPWVASRLTRPQRHADVEGPAD